ncbi:MAG: zinc ribbon domain-containing protein [Clostridia bacterium]|nr:zinc ribbon domain-containing protein [Clostridia bacterium]
MKGRACKPESPPTVPVRTDSRSLLTGLLFCGECGSRLCYNHNRKTKKLADGTERLYESNVYRCYRKVSSRKTCQGPSS